MTQHKHLKARVRSRMEKTGESYAVARRHVISRRNSAPVTRPAPAALPSRRETAISDQAISKRTGRVWEEWFAVLDRAGAARLDHRGIVALLTTEGVGSWWRQMIAVGYERSRGLREVHQLRDGSFQASVTRTLPVSVETLRAAWSARRRVAWLEGPGNLKVGKPTAPRTVAKATTPAASLRLTSATGVVEVRLFAKAPQRSSVTVEQHKLLDAEAVASFKATWKANLERLARTLGS